MNLTEAKIKTLKSGKKFVLWKESIPFNVKFTYKGKEGSAEIKELKNSKLVINYKNENHTIHPTSFLNVQLKRIIENRYLYDIGDLIDSNTGDYIVNRFIRKSEYSHCPNQRWYEVMCSWSEETYEIVQHLLTKGVGSPYRNGHKPCKRNNLNLFPEIVKYLKYPEKAIEYTPYSEKPITCVCPDCKTERKYNKVATLTKNGFDCKFCSGIMSYGEKYVSTYLELLEIPYEQYKRFDWLSNREYDFYLPTHNLIIETHGEQHYKEVPFFGRTLKEQQDIDQEKRIKATSEGLNYMEINCSISTFEYMNQVIPRSLFTKLNVAQENSLRTKLRETPKYSNYLEIIKDFKGGSTIKELSVKYDISPYRCRKILKHENVYEVRNIRPTGEDSHIAKEVKCLNTGQIFPALSAAAKWAGLADGHQISIVCGLKERSAGKHPETGEPLKWEFTKKGVVV